MGASPGVRPWWKSDSPPGTPRVLVGFFSPERDPTERGHHIHETRPSTRREAEAQGRDGTQSKLLSGLGEDEAFCFQPRHPLSQQLGSELGLSGLSC